MTVSAKLYSTVLVDTFAWFPRAYIERKKSSFMVLHLHHETQKLELGKPGGTKWKEGNEKQ